MCVECVCVCVWCGCTLVGLLRKRECGVGGSSSVTEAILAYSMDSSIILPVWRWDK